MADVYFAIDIAPLRSLPEPAHKLFESVSIPWRVLKPRQKIKGLAEVMAVMKSPGDGGQVLQAGRNVVRSLLKNCPPFILGEGPPGLILANGDERGSCCRWAPKPLLAFGEGSDLILIRIANVACHTSKGPDSFVVCLGLGRTTISSLSAAGRPSPITGLIR